MRLWQDRLSVGKQKTESKSKKVKGRKYKAGNRLKI